ncbi:Methyltransferase-like protein 27 [Pseudocercospora fuligena]|uniref:Methyltransferase-like protein 27 n=1 Tax=Pseudocercospora fuligena TaxID=685502 RepID=A0A8H6VG07_9PEZI|nr:Methyltransferase-like protein 27 [Pseudocercospora fuligena]
MGSIAATTPISSADHRHRSYALKTPEEHIKLYDDWAAQYDADVMADATKYVGPQMTVQAVQAANGNLDGEILDAGCGTGLAGVALAQAGATVIDGIDLSPGMLKVARRTKVYRDLWPVDMLKPIQQKDNTYDIVTCVGTFTTGHVGATPALGELVRVLKKGGVLAATILDNLWVPEGFEAEVERLRSEKLVDVVSTDITDYRQGDGARSVMLVLRKL